MIKKSDRIILKNQDGTTTEIIPTPRAENIKGLAGLNRVVPTETDDLLIGRGKRVRRVTLAALKTWFGNLFAAKSHNHAAGEITSGTLGVARGGTGRSTLSSGYFLRGNGTGAVTQSSPTAARQAMSALTGVGPTTVTLSAANWAGSGPWTQTVSVSGVTASDNHIHIYPVDIADEAARKLYEAAYGCLAAQAETVAGGITFTCREKKPETNFQLVVEGGRV